MNTPHHNQLRWACRRGLLELDKFLLTFFDDCFDDLSQAEQHVFTELLNEPDQDLYNWLLGVEAAPKAEWQLLCDKIRLHAQQVL